jgi:hypothetical protein
VLQQALPDLRHALAEGGSQATVTLSDGGHQQRDRSPGSHSGRPGGRRVEVMDRADTTGLAELGGSATPGTRGTSGTWSSSARVDVRL